MQRRAERLKREHLKGTDIPRTEAILRAKQVVSEETRAVHLERQKSLEEAGEDGNFEEDLNEHFHDIDAGYGGGECASARKAPENQLRPYIPLPSHRFCKLTPNACAYF